MTYTLITGATGGIGRALAFEFAKNGHSLILLGRNANRLSELIDELNEENNENHYISYVVDLMDIDHLASILEEIGETYSIEVVINNAGIGIFEDIQQLTTKHIDNQLVLNVKVPMLMTTKLLQNVRQNKGSFIYMCSILSDFPNQKASVYVATKHALLGFANTIRLEYLDLHVLTVHPSTVRTSFFGGEVKGRFILEPMTVSRKVYRSYRKRKRRLNIPKTIGILRILYTFFPRIIDTINRKYFTNK